MVSPKKTIFTDVVAPGGEQKTVLPVEMAPEYLVLPRGFG
jgi:hypothetical protein